MKGLSMFAALAAMAIMASSALAQPYNVRGGFNAWGESPMNDDGDGTFSLTLGSLGAGSRFEWKVAQNDWAFNVPGSNVKSAADGSGSMTFHFRPGPIADGWNPGQDRVGYDDPGQFTWEIQGAFNNWDETVNSPARQMTNMGSGLYSVDYTIASPGSYDFKFRETNSWDVSIGGDFGNGAGNANVVTTNPNEIVRFELDLPNGRWRTSVVPEPGTLALLGLGGLAVIRNRRRAR